jgi:hypothetical protein
MAMFFGGVAMGPDCAPVAAPSTESWPMYAEVTAPKVMMPLFRKKVLLDPEFIVFTSSPEGMSDFLYLGFSIVTFQRGR